MKKNQDIYSNFSKSEGSFGLNIYIFQNCGIFMYFFIYRLSFMPNRTVK